MIAGAAFSLPPQHSLLASIELWVAGISALGVVGAAIVGGPVMFFINRFRRENTEQHAENLNVITEIAEKIGKVDNKVDNVAEMMKDHIHWHKRNDNA